MAPIASKNLEYVVSIEICMMIINIYVNQLRLRIWYGKKVLFSVKLPT